MAPRRWLVLSVAAAADDPLRELLAEGLLALGGLSVLDEGDRLITYLDPPGDPEEFCRDAGAFLADRLAREESPELTWRWQANEDWEREWRRGLRPKKIGPRLVIKPSWAEWNAAPGEEVIDIDPQMAFGTGEHATTRGCLRLLEACLREGDRVLDVGSGSGILSIAAARLGAGEVVAVEYDADANLNARENIVRNDVSDRVHLREALADPELLERLGTFDVVAANILSSVIRPLLSSFRDSLRDGGRLIVSGILDAEHEEVVADARRVGFHLEREEREEEWWSALFLLDGP
jgi:ribosomal protein L11 methyltransferase